MSITETLLELKFATSCLPSGVTATPARPFPTAVGVHTTVLPVSRSPKRCWSHSRHRRFPVRRDRDPIGATHHRDRGHHGRGCRGRVDHRYIVGAIRDIDMFSVRRDRDPRGKIGSIPTATVATRTGGGGRSRVDHRDSAGARIGDIGEGRRLREAIKPSPIASMMAKRVIEPRADAARLPLQLLLYITIIPPLWRRVIDRRPFHKPRIARIDCHETVFATPPYSGVPGDGRR